MTLSEMFNTMRQLQCGSTMVHSIKVYKIPHDNLGDVKVMSVVAARDKDDSVDVTEWDDGVFKVWIDKETDHETD